MKEFLEECQEQRRATYSMDHSYPSAGGRVVEFSGVEGPAGDVFEQD